MPTPDHEFIAEKIREISRRGSEKKYTTEEAIGILAEQSANALEGQARRLAILEKEIEGEDGEQSLPNLIRHNTRRLKEIEEQFDILGLKEKTRSKRVSKVIEALFMRIILPILSLAIGAYLKAHNFFMSTP